MRASDQRLPCGCPDCVVFARSSTLAPSVSASALASIHATVRHSPSHRQPRSVSSFVRGRHSPHRSALRPLSLGSSASQSQRRTDENMHRAASIRSPSPRVASPYDYTHAFGRSAASTYPRGAGVGVGMGIMVAATTGSLGCPSPAPTTPSLGFSTPRTGTSLSGSPAPSLSDDAGATTLNPIVISDGHEHDSEHSPSAASSATIRPFASVDASVSRGHLELGPSLAHMQVSPLVQDNTAGSPAPSISGVTPSQIKSGDIPFSPRAEGEQQQQGWFTEVDWFGVDGPLACYEPRV
ncbi:hypothetical protein L227DRAFT_581791 [Lentinus tigrinus ALCF2SS1-6]|uniref:Uncharacterized protein n=2 Tax=Lentinus tigrinus TaxID=5365 RepID=A0A5C2RP79_9APHY|nr:hypothetical protein L227DRAFT_581791 [Lentinus tigrinus ALCF2SS1-6]